MRTWRVRARVVLAIVLTLIAIGAGEVSRRLPELGAGGVLHPARRHVTQPAPASCLDTTFSGDRVTLTGWTCRASGPRIGTLVYLHGIADNRTSAVGAIQRFTTRGFDVIAYDSRAHGDSGGEFCTYGVFESRDLRRVIADIEPGLVVLLGNSLGAAVALQAADDPRVSAVVAAEAFSDLRAVATERAPFVFTHGAIARAFDLVEQQGHFKVDDASPLQAAATITAPVLLIHGAADVDTRPDHSKRIYAALHGPKQLILVPGAGHNGSLRPEVWQQIEDWIDRVVRRGSA